MAGLGFLIFGLSALLATITLAERDWAAGAFCAACTVFGAYILIQAL